MRRKEFEMMDTQETQQFLDEMSFGFLGTVGEDGWPRLTPLNFVSYEGSLYFHGSKAGEKMAQLQANPHATFAVAKEYAIIPSYFSDPKLACPATAYFKSVLIKGFCDLVTDLELKAAVMNAFMRKLQPEGGYAPIDSSDPDYVPQLKATAVLRLAIHELSAKYKFGQNLKPAAFEKVAEGLQQRNGELDAETAALMKAFCPHHQK